MKLVFAVGLLFTLVSCKTLNSKSELAQAKKVEAGEKSDMQGLLGDYEFVGGKFEVQDSYDRPYSRTEIKTDPERAGTFSLKSDGAFTLAVNFAVVKGRSGDIGPGVLVSINPTAKPKVEQYTVSNQGWVGDSVTEEKKIETVEGFEPGEPNPGVTLSRHTNMSSRRYKWVMKDQWKQFKTITTKISVTAETLTFTESSADEMWKEALQLNFKRK